MFCHPPLQSNCIIPSAAAAGLVLQAALQVCIAAVQSPSKPATEKALKKKKKVLSISIPISFVDRFKNQLMKCACLQHAGILEM